MARRYRYEYLQRKKARELKRAEREAQLHSRSSTERKVRELFGWVLYIAVLVCAVHLITTYVGQRTVVAGDSMLNTLHDKDNLIIDKVSYRFRAPERYEIIVFPYRYAEETFYIKRIIGLPGETVQIIEGYVYVNGEKLGETYGRDVIDSDKYGIAAEPVELGEDEYFVLGDNRNESADSRETSVGVLKRKDLIGRAWVRVWPLEDFGVIDE
ncbi:MAG: signal peptidase I [Tyzzerella sp.]|nr:signal peptidase I [Tyzzerella sp.]